MEEARDLLEAQRRQALQRLASLTGDFHEVVAASRDSNADDEHDPEGATIAFERSQVTSLVQQVQTQLAEIEAAFDRLSAGTYGSCEHCAQPITPARLRARPAARTCVTCAQLRTT
ncbi:TraR/DksA family transcriptional regulator [Kribbella rubisoli]|jgi:DnaK suppressor protein|uniref:TraR/DksA family transcriptional regulator n=1 Tax=Kribbella rubisoli TaxID=3075929 RepID=A0A4V2FY68_9ACTN|nr:TraR/DksA C4-type zinc finger protein [Kribbella rubisoli]RZU16406.1 TraR/DksA family transcriptional regulator [Kribbella rubisoli]